MHAATRLWRARTYTHTHARTHARTHMHVYILHIHTHLLQQGIIQTLHQMRVLHIASKELGLLNLCPTDVLRQPRKPGRKNEQTQRL